MKIPLLTSLGKDELTYLNNAILLRTPRMFTKTFFILDTGSPETILGFADARRLQIPFNSLSKGRIVELGGKKHQGYLFNRLTFKFLSEEGKVVEEEFPITVIKLTSQKDTSTDIPTIIGMDFLKEKKYVLYCDVSGDVAYLEKKEN
ncbi:MAG: hypothetical protein ABIH28_00720 [archaeon]